MEDLENRSKRNNVITWGVKEGSEKDFISMEEFIEEINHPVTLQGYLRISLKKKPKQVHPCSRVGLKLPSNND